MITRRGYCFLVTSAASPVSAARESGWTSDWDRAIITNAVGSADASFDPSEALATKYVGPEYHYHTNVRNASVHPTRESLDYALLLLEAGGQARIERARAVIQRVLDLQDTDPASKWYGIWGWYMEEPPPEMSPADWNWADFNGSLLLLIENRHSSVLPEQLRKRILEAIRHAAYSVKRRNVSMNYTNIAVQGTFVTLAAAELLKDPDLHAYAQDRLIRFARNLDQTGSFTEYNSPTYTHVTIANLTRIMQVVRDKQSLPLVDSIHERAWQHLGKHWHVPTRQLAGPMSRAYSTDIGKPLWIQKALDNRLRFATLEEIRSRELSVPGEVAILQYRCPSSVVPMFLEFQGPRQHREIFISAEGSIAPVQGTTWLAKDYCLGSVNRGDFWIQRRPLLAYWGTHERPAKYIQFRFIKDEYDFTSALLYSVQDQERVLGLVNFRSPGGDKHPSLDVLKAGEFSASRLRLLAEIQGGAGGVLLADGRRIEPHGKPLPFGTRLSVDLGGAKFCLQPRAGGLGARQPSLSVTRDRDALLISVDLVSSPGNIVWRDLETAYLIFTTAMDGSRSSLAEFDSTLAALPFEEERTNVITRSNWGHLGLQGAAVVETVELQNERFASTLNAREVPMERLSDARLAL